MFRALCCAALGFGLMLVSASTEARELELSVENRIGGDSNVFGRSSDHEADGFYSLSPRLSLREGHSNLNYDFSYQPTYKAYFTTSGINGFDHRGNGALSWRATAADSLAASATFSSRRSFRREDQSASSSAPVEGSDQERVQRSDAQLSYSRALSEGLSIQGSASLNDVDYSRNTSIDSRAYSGQLGTQYILNPTSQIGFSGTFRRREDRGVGNQFTTETDIWNIGMSVQRALTPTITISMQGGPSFIRSRQKASTAGDPDDKSRTTSYFAAVSLDKSWKRSEWSASYTRSESSGGGTASSSIVDNVRLDFRHRLSRRWRIHAGGTWLQSKEISEVRNANRRKITQYRVVVEMAREITRQLSVVGQFWYSNQDENRGATSASSIGDVSVGFISVRYTFDPVRF